MAMTDMIWFSQDFRKKIKNRNKKNRYSGRQVYMQIYDHLSYQK